MTGLRTAAQQALEALEKLVVGSEYEEAVEAEQAIDALKAALAEPENWELRRLSKELERCKQTCAATSEAWREEAALAEPVEPVAWLWRHRETGRPRFLMPNERTATDVAYAWDVVGPLYLAPPQRKPEPNSDYERGFVDGMSEQARRSVDKAVNAMIKCKPLAEEEIARLVTNDMVKFARAIERAHGIGGAPEERHFCPRCGKRTQDIHTCTPP